MKITVICDVLGEENNGATHAGMNFINSMQSKGHDVTIVCPDQFREGQENYYVCPARSFGPLNGYVRKVGVTIAKADDEVIEKAIKDADIIHCHLPFTMSNHAIKLAKQYNIPSGTIFTWVDKKNHPEKVTGNKRGRKKETNLTKEDWKERYEILKKYQAFLKAQ